MKSKRPTILESKSFKNQLTNYLLGKTIAKSEIGKKKMCQHKETKESFIVEIFNKSKMNNFDFQNLTKKFDILKELQNPGFLKFHEFIEKEDYFFLIYENFDGIDLFTYLSSNGMVDEKESLLIFKNLVSIVEFIQLNNICHRDIRLETILIDSNKNLKLSDFSFATRFESNKLLLTPCGSFEFSPPECFKEEGYNGYDIDIWSCGVVLYAIVCQDLPFIPSDLEFVPNKYELYFPNHVSEELADLIKGILKVDKNERFKLDSIKKHKWFLGEENEYQMKNQISVEKLHDITTDSKVEINNENVESQNINASLSINEETNFIPSNKPKSLSVFGNITERKSQISRNIVNPKKIVEIFEKNAKTYDCNLPSHMKKSIINKHRSVFLSITQIPENTSDQSSLSYSENLTDSQEMVSEKNFSERNVSFESRDFLEEKLENNDGKVITKNECKVKCFRKNLKLSNEFEKKREIFQLEKKINRKKILEHINKFKASLSKQNQENRNFRNLTKNIKTKRNLTLSPTHKLTHSNYHSFRKFIQEEIGISRNYTARKSLVYKSQTKYLTFKKTPRSKIGFLFQEKDSSLNLIDHVFLFKYDKLEKFRADLYISLDQACIFYKEKRKGIFCEDRVNSVKFYFNILELSEGVIYLKFRKYHGNFWNYENIHNILKELRIKENKNNFSEEKF